MVQDTLRAADETAGTTGTCRELFFQDGTSNKFWKIQLDGSAHTVIFGRIGTQGQQQTKEFESDAAARKSFDKLVAEKLKKGYADAANAEESAAAVTKEKSKPVSKARPATKAKADVPVSDVDQPVPAQPVISAQVAAVKVDLQTPRSIDLEPEDWYRAAFHHREPLVRGAAAPFDLSACMARLSKLRTESYGWDIRWQDLKLPAALSREEAHFWLTAMTTNRERDSTPKQLADKLAAMTFDGRLSTDAVRDMVAGFGRHLPEKAALAIANLLPVDQYVEQFWTRATAQNSWQETIALAALLQGFSKYILPYLTAEELEAMRHSLRQRKLEPTQFVGNSYQPFPVEFYLAAMLGMHDEVYAITSTWADDRYSKEQWRDHYERPQDILPGLGSPELVGSEWRRLGLRMLTNQQVRAFLACTEYSALDCVRDSVLAETNKEKCEELLDAFALVHAPEAAAPMLDCKISSKMPGIAREWLDANAGHAIAGLIETAAGRGKQAEAAIEYLRSAKRQGHASAVDAALQQTANAEVAGKVRREVLDHQDRVYASLDDATTPDWLGHELTAIGKLKSRTLPAWAMPAMLPPLVVGEQQLNDQQLTVVLNILASSPINARHSLLSSLRQHADRHTCDEFAWKLFQSWTEDGAPSKEKWAMGAIGQLGGDGCALRLTPLVRAWPGESQHQRAVYGLECLRAIGSDVALMQLAGIAQKLKFKGLKTKAEQFVNEIAQERGMTRAELEDRVVPDCGLDENGCREFSFGSRSFSFVLGNDQKPMIRDADGKLRGDLPKPGGKDDAALAEQSLADWKLLKKQIKEVAQIQAGRLEQAMVTGRRWKVADFETLLVRHPLMTHLTRQLIWGAFDKQGDRVATFRVTEEGDLADVEDNATSLEQAEMVGVLHPLELSAEERAAWGEVLSDYEIVSSFLQLGRGIYTLEGSEANDEDLKRMHGIKLAAPTLVFTLEKLGWVRGTAMDGGCFDEHSKQFPAANVTAVIGYEGNVAMGYIDPNEMLTVTSVQFCPGMRAPSGYGWDRKDQMKLGQVPPVVISEVLADLSILKGKSK